MERIGTPGMSVYSAHARRAKYNEQPSLQGVETYINYIWQFNLKGSSLESQILDSAPFRYNSLSAGRGGAVNNAIATAGNSQYVLWF